MVSTQNKQHKLRKQCSSNSMTEHSEDHVTEELWGDDDDVVTSNHGNDTTTTLPSTSSWADIKDEKGDSGSDQQQQQHIQKVPTDYPDLDNAGKDKHKRKKTKSESSMNADCNTTISQHASAETVVKHPESTEKTPTLDAGYSSKIKRCSL